MSPVTLRAGQPHARLPSQSEGAVPTVRHGADAITCRALDCVGPFVSLVSALYGDGGSGMWFRLWIVGHLFGAF